jgi:hypothetical protein
MAFTPKDNSGSLFQNDRKASDKQPDEKGTALIDGKEYWVSGWWKKSQRGEFLSLAFTVKEQRDGQQQPDRQPPAMRSQPASRQRAQVPEDDAPTSADADCPF